MHDIKNVKVGVIGLGYVGLPLAAEFGKSSTTIGFDINRQRVAELQKFEDRTQEVTSDELRAAEHLSVTHDLEDLAACNVYIVTVPTPIDRHKRPDLRPLESASRSVATVLSKGDVVIYESTVYPGATEEVCIPLLEAGSGLTFNTDFFAGYSPERINPGDKKHRLPTIVKVTSGSTPEVSRFVADLYRTIITAGVYEASSLKVAEAAKVIENTQRDVNIALINELALIFEKIGIDTLEVLEAAGTKWNFLPFRPGLVGGHCIGVDPYYLTHKAKELGYHPEMVLAGRRINDSMGEHVAMRVVKLLAKSGKSIVNGNVLILGLTFKENCPDLRNTKIVDVVSALKDYNCQVDVHDPWVDLEEAKAEYGVDLVSVPEEGEYDAVILGVSHHQFVELGPDKIRAWGKEGAVLFDVKSVFPANKVDGRL